jgi:dTDP-4-amino-4,6-dideoxy-D-galactose acyltransferase
MHVHALQELESGLERSGLGSPHAFIRQINAGYDRKVRIAELTRPMAPENDFRIAVGDGDEERWVFLEKLPWDSEFFSRGMARLNCVVAPSVQPGGDVDVAVQVAAIQAALGKARDAGIDYVLSMVDAVETTGVRSLGAAGFELIEVRCHYHMPLSRPPEVRYPTRLATAADVPTLARAARDMVNPYDRFHADPEIPAHDADRMMERWVHASILEGFADATVVPDVDGPAAFCTAKYHREQWQGWGLRLAQPVLSAVSTAHRGWYVKIISELNEHLRSIGAEHSYLITQITNNAVIRCWEKLGYQFGKGEYVFRKILR